VSASIGEPGAAPASKTATNSSDVSIELNTTSGDGAAVLDGALARSAPTPDAVAILTQNLQIASAAPKFLIKLEKKKFRPTTSLNRSAYYALGMLWAVDTVALSGWLPILGYDLMTESENADGLVTLGGVSMSSMQWATVFDNGSLIVSILMLTSFGGLTDFLMYRKRILVACGTFGSLLVTSTFFCWSPGSWWWALIVSGLSTGCLFLTDVCVNSYLPLLAMGHERVLRQSTRKDRAEAVEAIELSMSNFSMALGFGATLAFAAPALGLQFAFSARNDFIRTVCGVSGLFWLAITLYAWRVLPPLPGPPPRAGNPLIAGWSSLARAFRSLRYLRNARWFMLFFFITSDSVQNFRDVLSGLGEFEVGIPDTIRGVALIAVPACSLVGCLAYDKLAERSTDSELHKWILIGFSILGALFAAYVALGFNTALPIGVQLPVGTSSNSSASATCQAEFLSLTSAYGLLVESGYASFTRTFLLMVVPREEAGAFAALYTFTEILASNISLTVAFSTSTARNGFLYSAVASGLAVLCLGQVQSKKEKRRASVARQLAMIPWRLEEAMAEISAAATMMQRVFRGREGRRRAEAARAARAAEAARRLARHA